MFLFQRSVGAVAVLMPLVTLVLAAAPASRGAPPGAAPAGAKPPAAKPMPIVTITRADGTTTRGQLVSADAESVVVRASATAEPLAVPWATIKRVSNGLTQAQAAAQWKEVHKDQLCDTCHGDRVSPCTSCHGRDVDPSKQVPCDGCGGAGVTSICPEKRCLGEGAIDCPKPCLKLTQGTWRMRPDGKRWREFPSAMGTYSVSEGHLGEIIDVRRGGSQGACTTCGGTTKVDCTTCSGMGAIVCEKCHFAGTTGPPCPKCKAGNVACTTCKGTGLKA